MEEPMVILRSVAESSKPLPSADREPSATGMGTIGMGLHARKDGDVVRDPVGIMVGAIDVALSQRHSLVPYRHL